MRIFTIKTYNNVYLSTFIIVEIMTISTFKDLARISASTMLTSNRVGLPSEDASMAVARPILSKINGLGLVTDDSQMGKKEEYRVKNTGNIGTTWQRAYISGFMSRENAEKFRLDMDLIGETFVVIKKHKDYYKDVNMDDGISVTRFTDAYGSFETRTRTWTGSCLLEPQWINLLPELDLGEDIQLMNKIEKEVVYVCVTDMKWGRAMWLFETVLNALSGNVQTIPAIRYK